MYCEIRIDSILLELCFFFMNWLFHSFIHWIILGILLGILGILLDWIGLSAISLKMNEIVWLWLRNDYQIIIFEIFYELIGVIKSTIKINFHANNINCWHEIKLQMLNAQILPREKQHEHEVTYGTSHCVHFDFGIYLLSIFVKN